MNGSVLALKRGLLFSFPWIKEVSVYRTGYSQYFKITLSDNLPALSEEQLLNLESFRHKNCPAGLETRFGTEAPPSGYQEVEIPEGLRLFAESTGLTEFDYIATANILFPGSLICQMEFRHDSQTIAVFQQPDGLPVSLENLNAKFQHLLLNSSCRITSIEKVDIFESRRGPNPLDIIPSGLLTTSHWRDLANRDEEFALRFQNQAVEGSLRFDPENRATAFLSDSRVVSQEVRPLLATFDRIIISPPTKGEWSLDIGPDDAFKLIEMGKMQVLCPKNPSLYESEFVKTIAQQYPTALIGPRAAGLFALADNVRRNPLLKLLLSRPSEARIVVLAARQVTYPDANIERLAHGLVDHFVKTSLDILNLNYMRGGSHSAVYGLGSIAEEAYKLCSGDTINRSFEFMAVGQVVQLGAALDAVVLPWSDTVYEPYFHLVARSSSGHESTGLIAPNLGSILDGLRIPVYYDMPIEQYAGLFEGLSEDIRSLIGELVKTSVDEADLERRVRSFSQKADEVATRNAQFSRLNILGSAIRAIPLHAPLIKMVLSEAMRQGVAKAEKLEVVQNLKDELVSGLYSSEVSAVRLARIRSTVAERSFGGLFQWISRRLIGKG
jgi:hypothetical protein